MNAAMNEDRFEELATAEIDGVITPAESAELAAFLAENPTARRSYAQMREVAGLLGRIEALEPPAGLLHEVLDALPDRAVATPRPGLLSLLREAWTGRRILVYGYGLAAILVLAFVGKEFISPGTTVGENDGVAGTMAPSSIDTPEFDEISLDQQGLSGSIRLVRRRAETRIEVDATSRTPLVLVLSYDPTLLDIDGVVQNGGLAASAVSEPGRVRLGGETVSGVRRYAYVIRVSEIEKNIETRVDFAFLESGDPLQEGSLTLAERGGRPDEEGTE